METFHIEKVDKLKFKGVIKAPHFEIKSSDTLFKINEKNSPLDAVIEVNDNKINLLGDSFSLKTTLDLTGLSEKLSMLSVSNTIFLDDAKESFLETRLIRLKFQTVRFTGKSFSFKCIKSKADNIFKQTCFNNLSFSMQEALFEDEFLTASIPDAKLKIGQNRISFFAPAFYLKTDVKTKGIKPTGFCEKKLNNQGTIDINTFINGCFKKGSIHIDDFVSYKGSIRRVDKNTGLNNLKEVQVQIYDNNFDVFAKVKMLATINVKFDGKVFYKEDKNEIIIDINKGSVAGIPSTSFILTFIEKFISSDQITINGNIITIKLL